MHHAQREERPLAPVLGGAHLLDGEARGCCPASSASARQRRSPSRQRGDQQPRRDAAGQLFEDEDRSADGSVESHGQSRARAGRLHHAAVFTFRAAGSAKPTTPKDAPICTVGPSRPSARPLPMASSPPKNFTGTTAAEAGSTSPLKTASTRCTPLPSAVGANLTTSRRARNAPAAPTQTGKQPADVGMLVRPHDHGGAPVVGEDEEIAEQAADNTDQHPAEDAGRHSLTG